MKVAAGGRHCERCDKHVVDFSAMNERDAVLVVALGERGSICGRLLLAAALATAACGGTATPATTSPSDSRATMESPASPAGDRDRDGISDADDKCPNEPETFNGRDDEDGCPDHSIGVVLDTSDVEVPAQIPFTKNVAKVALPSLPTLDELARVLKNNPDLGTLEVRGHATPDEANAVALAKDRGNAVVEALVNAGVDRKRLRAAPALPAASPDPVSGRAVDFRLVPAETRSAVPTR